jgi:hypothetical protein
MDGSHRCDDRSRRRPRLGVIGWEEQRGERLRRLGEELGFEARPVLDVGQVRYLHRLDFDELLEAARRAMREHPVDGLATYWDFPSSSITAILAEEQGLPGPGLPPTVIFEHKYWSRLLQKKVAPDDTPAFAGVDVFNDPAADGPPLPYPFWLKPVKSFSGMLGFRVTDDRQWCEAITSLRAGIERLGRPFQQVLDLVDDVPEPVARLGGTGAIAEAILDGVQCTLEGHVLAGEVEVHGIFDIHRAADGSTFTHYTYPSRLPETARRRMHTIAGDLLTAAGFEEGAFNIEFFVDVDAGRTWILEINPRISQEHDQLMTWVDGATNLQVMAMTALGQCPGLRPRGGRSAMAGKFFVRRDADATVTRVPDARELTAIEERFSPCQVELLVREGDRLSELAEQEPYSYLVAYVHLGADDHSELMDRYEAVVRSLELGFEG